MIAEDQKKLKEVLAEISNSLTRAEAERDFINESIKALSDDLKLNKRVLRKLANAYHRQNHHEEQAINTEVDDLYEELYQ